MDYFWITLIVLIASLLKGITGFGFALVSLPFLIFWYPAKELIPVLVLCNLLASLLIVLQKKERRLVNAQFQLLIAAGGLFTFAGVLILSLISENLLIRIMGVFFTVLSLLSLFGVKYQSKLTSWVAVFVGAFIGVLTGAISVSGPPLALFLHSTKVDRAQFREIFAWFSIVTALVAILAYAYTGLLSWQTLKLTGTFFPILFIGSYCGKRFNKYVSAHLFQRFSLIITLVASLVLLLR